MKYYLVIYCRKTRGKSVRSAGVTSRYFNPELPIKKSLTRNSYPYHTVVTAGKTALNYIGFVFYAIVEVSPLEDIIAGV